MFSYSENDSDIILKDRISDIYQNYSLCDSNCEYDSIDIKNLTITWIAKLKLISKLILKNQIIILLFMI